MTDDGRLVLVASVIRSEESKSEEGISVSATKIQLTEQKVPVTVIIFSCPHGTERDDRYSFSSYSVKGLQFKLIREFCF